MAGVGASGGWDFDTTPFQGNPQGVFQPGKSGSVIVTDPFGGTHWTGLPAPMRGNPAIEAQERAVTAGTKAQADALKQKTQFQKELMEQLLGGGGLFGGIFGGGGTGSPSQPGFVDSPGSPGLPGGGSVIGDLLGDGGAGQRARIEQDFDTLEKNAMGHLESRGLGGSSLVANALAGVGREKSLAHGELDDRLFDRQFQAREASLNRATQLMSQLLGGIL